MITLYQLKMNANAPLINKAACDALPRGHSVCWNEPATGPLRVPYVWIFRLLDSSCIFRISEMWLEVIIVIKPYKHFISFHVSFWASSKLILIFTKWGGVALGTTFVHGPQCNFCLKAGNFGQHLLHHNTSFTAFSMNELKDVMYASYGVMRNLTEGTGRSKLRSKLTHVVFYFKVVTEYVNQNQNNENNFCSYST